MVTIRDIAKESGFSVATVSRVLNKSDSVKTQTRDKVLKAMKDLNYTPSDIARSLSRNETNTIGVVVPDINNPFFGQVIKGISAIADNENLYMLLYDTGECAKKEKRFLEMLKRQRIRGLIITPTANNDEFDSEFVNLLKSLKVPVVLIDRDIKSSDFDGVFLDNFSGAFEAVECLIKEGHEKIATIAGPITSKPGRDRLKGYKNALEANSFKINDNYIMYGDFKLESGYVSTKKLLSMEEPPTAIFVANNMMNIGCMKALIEMNKELSTDISLVGFDEVEMFDVMGLDVSVVSRPMSEMGEVAMEILINRIKGINSENKTKRIILSPTLKLRGSEKTK